jgi:prephenate dehydratase
VLSSNDLITIAYLGNPGSFSHQALDKFCHNLFDGKRIETIGLSSFKALFDLLIKNKANYGVIALENSSIGSITTNYDLIWDNPLYIVSETFIAIRHHLIALAGANIDEITQVYSHPAALDQCQQLFHKHTHMQPIVHWDTSSAVKLVRETQNKSFAAIASDITCKGSDLVILQSNIEDYSANTTRFALISKNKIEIGKSDTKPYKLSIAVELKHEPGSLAKLLNKIAGTKANLTKIESRPIPETPWHYRFFIDFELNDKEQYAHILNAFEQTSISWKIIGLYQTLV